MIKLRHLLEENDKVRKGDTIIDTDGSEGKVHKFSKGYAYCKFPQTHPHSFEPVHMSQLRSTDKPRTWKISW